MQEAGSKVFSVIFVFLFWSYRSTVSETTASSIRKEANAERLTGLEDGFSPEKSEVWFLMQADLRWELRVRCNIKGDREALREVWGPGARRHEDRVRAA
jgi:hypothetical protein